MLGQLIDMYTYQVNAIMHVNTCKKTCLKILLYSVLVLMALIIIVIPQILAPGKHIHHHRGRYPTDLKYILHWDNPKRYNKISLLKYKMEFEPGQTMFIQQKCPYINCYITYDRNLLNHDEDFDAVIFNVNDVKRLDIDTLNLTRDPDQFYIFRASEPAEKHSLCNHDLDNFFNLTWSYKLNSDIPQPLYHIYNKTNSLVGPKNNMKWIQRMTHKGQFSSRMQTKKKAVAWIVPKCKQKSKHQDFINDFQDELKGYNYTLDEFGRCGQRKCATYAKCNKLIEEKYFFQLVLEEYLSEYYVTDKIVTAMAHLTIPIVLGAGDYRNFLPPGSYINAQSFDMKKLGALIDYLIKNRDMYEYFFDWKNHYYFRDVPTTPVCELCKRLNKKDNAKSIKHFRWWWNSDYKDICQQIRLYKMFNNDNDM